jgi:hypothetical protein
MVKTYTIPDFGPSDLLSSETIGERRLKVELPADSAGLTDQQLRADPVPITNTDGAKDTTLGLTNDLLGVADSPPSGTGITGWQQATYERLAETGNSNLYREGVEVSAANPIPIVGTVVSTGAELRIEVPVTATEHSLLAAAYAVTSAIGDDYLLSTIRFKFSTTESKTITVSDTSGSFYHKILSTDSTVTLDGKKQGFNAGNQITIEVTQTAGVCLMDVDMTIERGAVPLTGNPVLDSTSYGLLDSGNSTNSPLTAGSTFTGVPVSNGFSELLIQCFADTDCKLFIYASVDGGVNFDDVTPVEIYAGVAAVFPLLTGPRTIRIDILNDSGIDQTVLRMAKFSGQFPATLSTFTGAATPRFFPATVVKAFDSETDIAFGDITGQSAVHRFGVNDIIDTVTTPEDVWYGGGTYTGFPTAAPENIEFFSSDAGDTGVLTYHYLASSTSTSYTTATVTLTGTTAVRPGHDVYRLNDAYYDSGDDTSFNVGNITARHVTTTANVFAVVRAGYSNTSTCAYTVPAKSTGLLKHIIVQVSKDVTAIASGAIWYRRLGKSPTMIEYFSASNFIDHISKPYGGIPLQAGDDVIVRILSSSVDGVAVDATIDILLRDES